MEDNDIEKLMNQSWHKMAAKLNKDLPVVKRERRYIFWFYLFLCIPAFGGFAALLDLTVNTHDSKIKILIKEKGSPHKNTQSVDDIIAYHSSEIAEKKIDLKKETPNDKSSSTNINFFKSQNIIPLQLNQKNTSQIVEVGAGVINNSNGDIKNNIDNNKIMIAPSPVNSSLRSIVSIDNLNQNIFLTLIRKQLIFPEIQSIKNAESRDLKYGINGSALMNGFRNPMGFMLGIYCQKEIKNNFIIESSFNYKIYNRYVSFLQNDGQSTSSSKNMDLSTSVISSAKNIYINNPGMLSTNQLNIANESILASSLKSVSYLNSDFILGYRVNSKVLFISGVGIERMIGASYSLNNQNVALFKSYNKTVPTQEDLESGNALLRKWLMVGKVGMDLQIHKKLSLRSNLSFGNLIHNTAIPENNTTGINTSTSSFDKNLTLVKTPESGNIFLELGLKYQIK